MSTVAGDPGTADPSPHRRHLRPVRVLQVLLGLALAAAMLVWGLPHFAKTSWGEVADVLGSVPWPTALGYLALVLVGLYSYTFVMTGAMPGLSHLRALVLNVCGSSVSNLLPGGGAVGLAATYSVARSWGFTTASVTTMAIVTGVWNTLARVCLPLIALLALAWGASGVPPIMRDAAIAGTISGVAVVALFVAAIASDSGAGLLGRCLDRAVRVVRRRHGDRLEQGLTEMRSRLAEVVRGGWFAMTAGMVGFFGFYYVLFLLVMHTTGVDLPFGQLFAAFAIGRLLTSVGVTPGGLGVTETASAAALVAWGAEPAAATAGVVLFSVYTHLMEIPLGALGWLAWTLMPKASAQEITDADAAQLDHP